MKTYVRFFTELRPSISIEFQACAENILCFVFEYVNGTQTQCRKCATTSMNYSIRMHESKMRKVLFKCAQLRCAPLSCPKRGDLVREPHNAARNHCYATYWLDYCGDKAQSVQRQAMRIMHSHHACTHAHARAHKHARSNGRGTRQSVPQERPCAPRCAMPRSPILA